MPRPQNDSRTTVRRDHRRSAPNDLQPLDLRPSRPGGRRRPWPVPPSLLVGLAPVVAFAVLSALRARPSDDYPSIGLTAHSVLWDLVLPESIAAGVLVLLVTALGWWRIVAVDPRRGRPVWTVVAPALVLAVALARLPFVDWGEQPVRYFALLIVGTLLVGVFEELLTRGILLVGLRRRLPEPWVWALSCVLFGGLHLLNALAGAALGTTLVQVLFAACFGSVLYVARRTTRSLLLPVLLHALWDFGLIAMQATDQRSVQDRPDVEVVALALLGLATFATAVLGVVTGVLVAWQDDGRRRAARRWRTVPPLEAFAVRGGDPGLQAGWRSVPDPAAAQGS